MRRARAAGVACFITVALLSAGWLAGSGSGQAAGGPVVVMGIDAEGGGPGGHGPISSYVNLIDSILGKVTNGGSNILVIGGGKFNVFPLFDQVTAFWNAVDAALPSATVTYVNGIGIPGQSFAGFAMLAVVSSSTEVPSGGLLPEENDALTARGVDVKDFVNGGGGLLGFTQAGFPSPYLYLGNIGAVGGNFNLDYGLIDPTPEGLAVGVTDALDVCCWHDEFTTYPSFLMVLATNAATGNAAALGGSEVMIAPPTTTTASPTSSLPPTPPAPVVPGRPTFTG